MTNNENQDVGLSVQLDLKVTQYFAGQCKAVLGKFVLCLIEKGEHKSIREELVHEGKLRKNLHKVKGKYLHDSNICTGGYLKSHSIHQLHCGRH